MGRISNKINSLATKVKTINKDSLDPFLEGKKNYNNNLLCVELLAKERLQTCKNCVNFVDEPISFLKINDDRLPEASCKMCNDCGCEIVYKIRQNIKKCDRWQK